MVTVPFVNGLVASALSLSMRRRIQALPRLASQPGRCACSTNNRDPDGFAMRGCEGQNQRGGALPGKHSGLKILCPSVSMTKFGLHPGRVGSVSGGVSGGTCGTDGRTAAAGMGKTVAGTAFVALAEGPALGAAASMKRSSALELGGFGAVEGG